MKSVDEILKNIQVNPLNGSSAQSTASSLLCAVYVPELLMKECFSWLLGGVMSTIWIR